MCRHLTRGHENSQSERGQESQHREKDATVKSKKRKRTVDSGNVSPIDEASFPLRDESTKVERNMHIRRVLLYQSKSDVVPDPPRAKFASRGLRTGSSDSGLSNKGESYFSDSFDTLRRQSCLAGSNKATLVAYNRTSRDNLPTVPTSENEAEEDRYAIGLKENHKDIRTNP
jgi:hypothetical protein